MTISAAEESQAEKAPSPSVYSQAAGSSVSNTSVSKAPPEPSVDFELDIKVGIDSGKCILHPKEPRTEEGADSKRYGLLSLLLIVVNLAQKGMLNIFGIFAYPVHHITVERLESCDEFFEQKPF